MSANDLYGSAPIATPSPAPQDVPIRATRPHRRTATRTANDLYEPASATSKKTANDLYGSSSSSAPSTPAPDWFAEGARKALNLGGNVATRLGVPRAMEALSRPGKAGAAFFAGEDPSAIVRAFTSGDPDQYAVDVDRIKQALALKHGGPEEQRFGGPVLDTDKLPPWGRGLVDFTVETLADPTTIAGGAAAKGIGGAAGAAARATAGGLSKTSKGRDLVDVFRGGRDLLTYGGSAKRELGDDRYHGAIAADNRQAAREAEATRRLNERYDATFGHLSNDDKYTTFQILNGERQATDPVTGRVIVPPHVARAAEEGRKLLNDAAAIQANASGRRRLAYNMAPLANEKFAKQVEPWLLSYAKPGYADRSINSPKTAEMLSKMAHPDATVPSRSAPRRLVGRVDRPLEIPDSLKEFAAPDDQGIFGSANLRRDYLPAPRAAAAPAAKTRPQPYNLLRPFAPNSLQRESFTTSAEDVPALEDAFRSALRGAARQGTAGRLRQEVGAPLSTNAPDREPSALEQLFDVTPRAEGDARTKSEKAADLLRDVVQIPKNTVTAFGLKHGLVNVPTLALLSEGPCAALEAIAKGAALSRKTGADRYEAVRPGIEGGVITPFEDRKNALVDAAAKLPAIGKPLGALARGTNNLTWAIDDAAKQAVLRRKLARGMSPEDAAAQTMREMIDYRHGSRATKALGNIAPFATFRSRLPAAIASSVSRNPGRALALDRLTQGFASNSRVDLTDDDGNARTETVTNPFSDVVALTEEPQKYARATIADPLRALLSNPIAPVAMNSEYFSRKDGQTHSALKPDYFTYGEPLQPHYDEKTGRWKAGFLASQAANYMPFGAGDALLKATGTNEFPAQDWLSTLLGGVLGVHVR